LKTITLTQGQTALIDDIDFPQISKHKWYAQYDKTRKAYYAARKLKLPDGKRATQLLHRELLGLLPGDPAQVDHENLDGLDCRRFNLRLANCSQNQCNKPRRIDNSSGFKGITFNNWMQAYEARIGFQGKRFRRGYRHSAEAAFWELYIPASIEMHGEWGRA